MNLLYCIRCGQEYSGNGETGLCPDCSGESLGGTDKCGVPTRIEGEQPSTDSVPTRLEPGVADAEVARGVSTRLEHEGIVTKIEFGVSTRLEDEGIVTKVADYAAVADVASKRWATGDLILDTYVVKELLGEGGMGTVHRVHHRGWGMDLAVKSPKPEAFRTRNQMDIFETEAETWVKLGLHPHIASCYYVRRIDDVPRVFAELVEGGSLLDWIAGRKLTALEQMLDVAIQFAWGLHFSHEQGLVHQDVKPANVLLTPDGAAKVTDFGLARARAAAAVSAAAGGGGTTFVDGVGMTPEYCSPEQANNQPLSRKTDIWSWALSILELFAGSSFWVTVPGATVGQLAAEALEHYLEEGPTVELPPMPAAVVELLRECFRRNPDARPRDMAAIADRLVEVYQLEIGTDYPRHQLDAAELRADSLNNRAISFWDLDRRDEAFAAWREALHLDPQHAEALFNSTLCEWRVGRISDSEAVHRLQRATESGDRIRYFLAQVHLERGAADEAEKLLEPITMRPEGKNGAVWKALGDARQALGKNSEAEKALTRAHELLSGDRASAESRDLSPAPVPYWHRARAIEPHPWMVNCIAVSQDGRRVLSGCAELLLWNLETGEQIRSFVGHEGEINALVPSRDWKLTVSGGKDTTVRLWETDSGRCLRVLKGHEARVVGLALTPDEELAVSASEDSTLRVWRLATGECRLTLEGHDGQVRSVAVTPDGARAVSASTDRSLRVWDLATGRCLHVLQGHEDFVNGVAITGGGDLAVSAAGHTKLYSRGANDNTLRTWNLATGECLLVMKGHKAAAYDVVTTADGRFAVSGGFDKTTRVWDLRTGSCLRVFEEHTNIVSAVAITPDGRLAVSGEAERLLVWGLNLKWQRRMASLELSRSRVFEAVSSSREQFRTHLSEARKAWHGQQPGLAYEHLMEARGVAGFERDPEALDLGAELAHVLPRTTLRDSWPKRTLAGHSKAVRALAVTPDGRQVISASEDFSLRLWELASGDCVQILEGHQDTVSAVVVTPDGRRAVSSGDSYSYRDNHLRVWDLGSGRCVSTLKGHNRQVTDIALTVDGGRVVSVGWDGALRVWELASGKCVLALEMAWSTITSVCVTPDNRWAAAGNDKDIIVCDLKKGKGDFSLTGHDDVVRAIVALPDGRRILSSASDATLRLWDLRTGACLRKLCGHRKSPTDINVADVHAVAVTADGRFAFSGGGDRTVRAWNLENGACLGTLVGHEDAVTSIGLSPDSRYLVSGSRDKTLRIYELDWELGSTVDDVDAGEGSSGLGRLRSLFPWRSA